MALSFFGDIGLSFANPRGGDAAGPYSTCACQMASSHPTDLKNDAYLANIAISFAIEQIPFYQTRHIFSRTIACPLWQPNACANSGIFETTLSTRNRSSGWGLLMTRVLIISGRTLLHHTPA